MSLETSGLVLLGGGGHAVVLLEALRALGAPILGASIPPGTRSQLEGIEILGQDKDILKLNPAKIQLVNGLGSVSEVSQRGRIYSAFVNAGFRFASVIHPRSYVSPSTTLGAGVQIMAGAVIQARSTLSDNVLINSGAVIEHDTKIGKNCHVAPGATLSGGVEVGSDCHIGVGSTIIQGISLGSGSLLGAGSVVVRDLPAGSRAWGNPAREMGS